MAISDEAVKAKTGKNWKAWFSTLDKAGARKMKHSEIAALLYDKHNCPPWWSQMVANTYEQARGMRKKHEMPDGYQIGASKTLSVPASKLYSAFEDRKIRAKWLRGDRMGITTARKNKSIRAKWGDMRIDINFYPKGNKVQVALGHNKIPSEKEAVKLKAYWKKSLAALAAFLE
ncbi:MAG TPA: DUF4287 domain-containing protein [Candidatus Bilamarchaeum sp.]|nr:DUF4287 domain-containing protein [Candidatus Bilamarchaeum sp.]